MTWHGACDSTGVKLAFCLLFAVLALGGCGVARIGPAAAVSDWARVQGGEVVDGRLDRVCAIGRTMPTELVGVPLQFHILNSPQMAAYSWDRGMYT